MAEQDWLQMLGQFIQPGGTAGWLQQQEAVRPQASDVSGLKYPGDEISAVPMGMSDPISVLASLFTPAGMRMLQQIQARAPLTTPKIFGSERGSLEDLRPTSKLYKNRFEEKEPPPGKYPSQAEQIQFEKEHPDWSEFEIEREMNSREAPDYFQHRLNSKSEAGDYGDFAMRIRDMFHERLRRGEVLSPHDATMLKKLEDYIAQHQLDEPF